MDLKIQFDGGPWLKLIDQIKKRLDAESLLWDAGEVLREDVRAQFQEQGDPAWEPLSPRRYNERVRDGNDDPLIMIDTSRLMISWTESGGEHVEVIDTDSIVIGTTVFYADLMQEGGVNDEGFDVPARPVAIREGTVEIIAKQVLEKLLPG